MTEIAVHGLHQSVCEHGVESWFQFAVLVDVLHLFEMDAVVARLTVDWWRTEATLGNVDDRFAVVLFGSVVDRIFMTF